MTFAIIGLAVVAILGWMLAGLEWFWNQSEQKAADACFKRLKTATDEAIELRARAATLEGQIEDAKKAFLGIKESLRLAETVTGDGLIATWTTNKPVKSDKDD